MCAWLRAGAHNKHAPMLLKHFRAFLMYSRNYIYTSAMFNKFWNSLTKRLLLEVKSITWAQIMDQRFEIIMRTSSVTLKSKKHRISTYLWHEEPGDTRGRESHHDHRGQAGNVRSGRVRHPLSPPQPQHRLEAQRASTSDQIQDSGDLPRIQAAFHSLPLSLSVAETSAVWGWQRWHTERTPPHRRLHSY